LRSQVIEVNSISLKKLEDVTLVAEGEGTGMKPRLLIAVAVCIFLVLPVLLGQVVSNANPPDQPPIASFTYTPNIPSPGETIVFNASASYDPDGWIAYYTWNFGDGNVTTITSPTVTHSYPVDGTYTVELTVTDDDSTTGVASAVIEVSTVAFFRVVKLGTLDPVSSVEVTAYYYNGSGWSKAPVGPHGFEIKYDFMTAPDLADSDSERYRNPGYTAQALRKDASNIGFDLHPSCWTVYFKFKYGDAVTYWPNDTTRVYTYKDGRVEAHDYGSGHRAYWDASASRYVIRVGDIPGNGVAPTESHPIIVEIACPPPTQKYYLTVRTDPTGITTIAGEGWYLNGTDVTLNATQYVDGLSGSRYRFNYWDTDGASQGIGVNPITVRMSANHTATAHYVKQYSVVFNQTGLTSDATGTVVTVNGSSKSYLGLPYTLWVDSGSSVTYSYNSPVSSSVSGKRYRLTSVSGPTSPITVTSASTVIGNYVTQYLVTFAQTGLDSTAIGTVVTVNGSAKTYSDLQYDWWVDSGSTVTYSYSSTISSSVTGKRFRLISVNCPPSQFIVTGPVIVTGNYCAQYQVTFTHTGLNSNATGTIVAVNGTSKTYPELPYMPWVDNGSTFTYSYSSTVSSSYANQQFRLNGITGPTSPFAVTGPTTVTGIYIVQYRLVFTHTGLDSNATGTVVTVNGSAKTYGGLPYTLWADNGSSIPYSYNSPVSSSVSGKRYRLSSVSGPSSPITVNGAATILGNYVTQYQLVFTHTGLDSDSTGTVVTVNGTGKVFGDLPYKPWIDCGDSVTYSYNSPVSSSVSGKQFKLTTVSGPASPITVTNSATITGNYVIQYLVTFAQNGLDSTATGTVVTVNGTAKTYNDLSYGWWVDSGSTVVYSYNDPVLSTVAGKQFKQTGISGPASPITVTNSVTVTDNYKIQYRITFDQTGVGNDFTGTIVTIDGNNYNYYGLSVQFWWDKDSSHNFLFASPLTVNASKQYVWSSTSGLSNGQNGALTITTSGSVVGNYVMLNCVTFDQLGVGGDFTGTILVVDGTPYSVLPQPFMWQLGSNHTFAFQSPLVVTANTKQYVWTSTTGLSNVQNGSITVNAFGSIIGHYKTQYYLSLATSPSGKANPPGSGWYDDGTYASISTDQYVYGGSRWRFAGWTTDDMSEIADPSSPSTTVFVDKAKIVTANYIHQYLITFDQNGLADDASGTVVTVSGTTKTYGQLPYAIWADEGCTLIYSYETTVSSTVSGKRFRLDSISGPSSPITVNTDANITGNYVTQYYLTVSSPYSTTGGQGWYDSGATAYANLTEGVVNHGNGTRRVFTNWNGDASGTNFAQSNPITMNGPKTAMAVWKTQYSVTFDQLGLDLTASGPVVTVNSISKAYGDLPYTIWVDSGGSATYSYGNVSSSTPGKRFILTGVSGPSSPITVTAPVTVIGDYKMQYQITFSQTGVGSDFTGTVVTIDSTGYTVGTLPSAQFWWDSGSSHIFSFHSPLVVNISKEYVWISTTGLSTLQSDTLLISGSGSVTGNYVVKIKYQITFSQTGVGSDFLGTVVIIDGVNYTVSNLPSASFWWDAGSVHTFAYQSPLVVNSNGKQYVWTSTSGLSSSQSGSITVSVSGSVIGNYKTQYYLKLATNPPAITSPSGEGWYDANSNATISTSAFKDIVPGSSQYRFNGWTTANMTEITDPTRSPTTVLMDEAKTVTANYVTQYFVTLSQTGVGPDFLGAVVSIDGVNYTVSPANPLPATFWWDKDSVHMFTFYSPLVVTANAKQYVWANTTGILTLQSGSITVAAAGSVVGNYKTQYYFTVTSPYGLPAPITGWSDAEASVTASVTSPLSGPTGTHYVCTGWTGTGSVPASGASSTVTFVMTQPSSITWNWKIQYYLTVIVSPSGIVTIPGENWYDSSTSAPLTAPTVSGYDFKYWDVDGNSQGNGVSSITVSMNGPHTATVHYQTIPGGAAAVGGYSISLTRQASFRVIAYVALVALFGAVLSRSKRKRK